VNATDQPAAPKQTFDEELLTHGSAARGRLTR